ncbi:MAG: TonB family protein [Lutibacter sp.]|nr:TonB family protein [Lutibacter sp.]
MKNNISNENISNSEVVIKFFINYNGEISDAQIIKKSNNLKLDTSIVIAIMNMPKWKPAEQDGKTVGIWITLPLRF